MIKTTKDRYHNEKFVKLRSDNVFAFSAITAKHKKHKFYIKKFFSMDICPLDSRFKV